MKAKYLWHKRDQNYFLIYKKLMQINNGENTSLKIRKVYEQINYGKNTNEH